MKTTKLNTISLLCWFFFFSYNLLAMDPGQSLLLKRYPDDGSSYEYDDESDKNDLIKILRRDNPSLSYPTICLFVETLAFKPDLEVAATLINMNADIHAVNSDGWTPLICAVRTANNAMVEFLLRNGANLNAIDRKGPSLIMVALKAEGAFAENIKYLVNLGCNFGAPEVNEAMILANTYRAWAKTSSDIDGNNYFLEMACEFDDLVDFFNNRLKA